MLKHLSRPCMATTDYYLAMPVFKERIICSSLRDLQTPEGHGMLRIVSKLYGRRESTFIGKS